MKYCSGLPLGHTRQMTDEERALVVEHCRRERRKRLALLAAAWLSPFILLAMFVALTSLSPQGDSMDYPEIALMVVTIGAAAALILFAVDGKKRYRTLHMSTNSQFVDVFGRPPDAESDDSDGALVDPIMQVADTGLILNSLRNENPAVVVAGAAVAELPPDTPAHSGHHPRQLALMMDRVYEQRQLAGPELADLQRLTDRHTRMRWYVPLVWAYCVFAASSLLWAPPSPYVYGRSALFAIVAAMSTYVHYHRLRLRHKLKKDLLNRAVVRVNEGHGVFEVLPVSLFVWTVNGEPSLIRRTGSSQKRL